MPATSAVPCTRALRSTLVHCWWVALYQCVRGFFRASAAMPRSCSFLCFLLLLGVGLLPLLFHLENLSDTIRIPNQGLSDQSSNRPYSHHIESVLVSRHGPDSPLTPPTDTLDPALWDPEEEEEDLDQQLSTEKESNTPAPFGIVSLLSSLIGSFNLSFPKPLPEPAAALRDPVGWKNLQQHMKVQLLRHNHLANICSQFYSSPWQQTILEQHLSMILVEDRSRLLYCEVPKVGCSNWKRVLMVLSGQGASVLDISHGTAHFKNGLKLLKGYGHEAINKRLNTYTMVLFVREPFERLVSAYRDKLENPEPYYHGVIGRPIMAKYRTNATEEALRTGDGVTFREFVRFLLDQHFPSELDVHWRPVSSLCHPCMLNYDFIGKFENLSDEANVLLWSIGAQTNIIYPDYKDRNPQDERTSSSIMRKYFSQLNATERQGLYDLYRLDYLMFDYPKPFPDLH